MFRPKISFMIFIVQMPHAKVDYFNLAYSARSKENV